MQFSPKNLPLIAIIPVLSALLLGCDKPASPTATHPVTSATSPTSAVTTSTITTVTSAVSSTTAILPTSAVTATAILPNTSPSVLPSLPASAPASTPNATVKADGKSAKSLITQPTAPNTPEDVLKKATNAMMAGNAKEAARYYHVEGVDMTKMLAQNIPVVQKQLKHLEISPTEYNADKTQAGIFGNLTIANNPQPKQTLYKFVKINGEWKIVE